MKIRHKKTKNMGQASQFNVNSLFEIYVYFSDWMDSDFIGNYDVWIAEINQWKDMYQAFKDKDLITDNYNTRFFEPENDEERERGYRL